MTRPFAGPLAALVFVLSPLCAGAAEPEAQPAAPADDAAPGCAVERAFRTCLKDAGNAAALESCAKAATDGANAELRRVIDLVKPAVQQDMPVMEAMAAAQMSWQTWIQRDCDVVAADWQGAAMQAGQRQACLYGHTLQRAQVLWQRHATNYEGVVPADCRPQP